MNVTAIIRKVCEDKGRCKAISSITISEGEFEFAVHSIKVIEGDKKTFVAMPSELMRNKEFKDVAHPINTTTRNMITEAVLNEYIKTIENGGNE